MTVAFRASANVTNGTAGTSVVVSRPAGTTNGDVLVAFIAEASAATITKPTGWTLYGTVSQSTSVTLAVYWKTASSEPTTWTWTLGSSARNWGWVGAYTGVDTTSPLFDSDSRAFSAGGTVFDLDRDPNILGFSMGISAAAGVRTATGSATTWTPSGTERADLSTNAGAGTDIAGEVQDSPNSVVTYNVYVPSMTASQAQSAAVAWAVTLKPDYGLASQRQHLNVTVEAAIGADLTADSGTWTWTALTTRVQNKTQVQITRGRADEAQQTQPSVARLRMNNTDGFLTPKLPASPYYGLWGHGTPLRVKVTTPTVGPYTRFQGRITSIAPTWPNGNSDLSFVDIEAQGILYSLGLPSTPAISPLKAAILASNPVGYWPGEDGSKSTRVAPAVSDDPMSISGTTATFGSGGPPGSAPLISFGTSTTTTAPVNMSISATTWTVEFYVQIPSAPTGSAAIVQWQTLGTMAQWRFTVFPGTNQLGVEVWDRAGNQVSNLKTTFSTFTPYGKDLFVSVASRQNAGNIQYEWIANSQTGHIQGTGGSVAGTNGPIIIVGVPAADPGVAWDRSGWTFGHWAAFDSSLDSTWGTVSFAHKFYLDGLDGELPGQRISDVATQAGIPETNRSVTTLFSSDLGPFLGPRSTSTPLAVMRAAELADFGILTDGLTDGLQYIGGQDRYNLPVTLALDASKRHIRAPFEPVEDDARLINKVTVSRTSGSSATFTDPAVAMEGEYPTTVTLNVTDDSTLLNQASFRVHLATAPQMRVPVLMVNFRNNPELIGNWLIADIGHRCTVSNLPLTQFPAEGLDLVLEQYTETISMLTWTAQLSGSPYQVWHGFVLDTDRLDAQASTLASNASAGALSLSVATAANYPLWTTDATDFPFDISVGGFQTTVSTITGSSSPQTFTVSAMPGAVTTGDQVSLWNGAVLAL